MNVSKPKRIAFLTRHSRLAVDQGPNNCGSELQKEAESSQWVVVSDLPATEDRYNSEWLVVDASEQ